MIRRPPRSSLFPDATHFRSFLQSIATPLAFCRAEIRPSPASVQPATRARLPPSSATPRRGPIARFTAAPACRSGSHRLGGCRAANPPASVTPATTGQVHVRGGSGLRFAGGGTRAAPVTTGQVHIWHPARAGPRTRLPPLAATHARSGAPLAVAVGPAAPPHRACPGGRRTTARALDDRLTQPLAPTR